MKPFNTSTKFRILHIMNHVVAIAGLYLVIASEQYLWFLAGLLFFLYAGIVGINVGLHRFYSHRSFTTTIFKERLLLWSSVLTSVGSPAMWCSVHRMHHSYSDQDKDPHNPIHGKLKTWLGLWKPISIPKRFIVPFLKTKELKFVHNNYFLLSFSLLIFLALIDLRLAAFVYAIPAVGCFHGAQSIGVLPHLWGYRRYNTNDKSHNNWLASILALGEGWHNNHHANPGRWYQGETWWEIDPPAFVIKHFFMNKENILGEK
jgi:stearoyl-CoA desaturase (delta-9 desaturase)